MHTGIQKELGVAMMFAHSQESATGTHRRHPRVPVPARARCWCETDDITLYAKVQNISESGLCIRTCAPLPAGSSAKVRFALESGQEIFADVLVVWAHESDPGRESPPSPGMGLRFLNIDDPSATAIREFARSGGRL